MKMITFIIFITFLAVIHFFFFETYNMALKLRYILLSIFYSYKFKVFKRDVESARKARYFKKFMLIVT